MYRDVHATCSRNSVSEDSYCNVREHNEEDWLYVTDVSRVKI